MLYALCPMLYALCPMPYALRSVLHAKSLVPSPHPSLPVEPPGGPGGWVQEDGILDSIP